MEKAISTQRKTEPGDARDTLLEVRDLRTHFTVEEGEVCAVDGVTFRVTRGKVLAIVGESG